MIALITKDMRTISVPKDTCMQCNVLRRFLEEDDDTTTLPVPNVSAPQLQLVIAACLDHDAKTRVFEWPVEDVLAALDAAIYLECQPAMNHLSKEIACRLKGKTREDMRVVLGLKNDENGDAEEKRSREIQWLL
jgi:hypothetical protein